MITRQFAEFNASRQEARIDFGQFLSNSRLIAGAIAAGGSLVIALAGHAMGRRRWRGATSWLSA